MKRYLLLLPLLAAGLAGCMTLSGTYALSLHSADGKPLTQNMRMVAQGSGIYGMRNAMCAAHPSAVVTITDLESGEELKSESPYQCH
ncbi:hypothetical protein [Phytopseudomonas dryadis]|uniref:Lipoprotein n=1 Tax=Phytopseudomonas dryadis TaxID=2487520 RepID=A0ABY1ZBH9_9GAMM|nr:MULTISPECIES: hypothetical protein [Pseudomonas]TBV07022.1 hypothetical protein DNK34_09350 [Pseudomonas dryadis]TBV19585.1 hypothetical protein DNK41_03365 [Pseudomonas sp. FRB 230]